MNKKLKKLLKLTNQLFRSINKSDKLINEHAELFKQIVSEKKIDVGKINCANCAHSERGKDENGNPAGYWCTHDNIITHDEYVFSEFFCCFHPFFKEIR